jgi:hypothetical protein
MNTLKGRPLVVPRQLRDLVRPEALTIHSIDTLDELPMRSLH